MEVKSKSMLAKLLATENISVEHQNVPTAMFDLKNRKIILPRWKEMSVNLYDLFVGHEISHALETPSDGWHDAVCEKGKGFKSFLNVIEDCRIEKKVKVRYPGLVKSMTLGYKELMEKNFFGLNGRDIDTLPLIDKINLKFKCGAMLGINFSEEELPFITAIENVDTWEDTVKVANELYEYSKTEQAMQDALDPQADEFGEDWDEEYLEEMDSGMQEGETSDIEESSDSEETDQETDEAEEGKEIPPGIGETESEESEEVPSKETSYGRSESGDIAEGESEPESMTDKAFRDAEETLVHLSDSEIMNVTFPKIKTSQFVMQADEVWDFVPEYMTGNYYQNTFCTNSREVEQTMFQDFQTRNKSAINLLVQQFEMRRKATSLKKARENKTGMLNDKKLWAYKLTDDLFLSTTTTPDGQNHGMFMLVDMSGSMYSNISNVVEQLLIQVSFCKKVAIPFDVYGFTTSGTAGHRQSLIHAQSARPGDLYINDDNFKLLQLISSELSAPMYAKAFKALLGWASGYSDNIQKTRSRQNMVATWQYRGSVPNHLSLSTTPLASAVLVARDLAVEFKNRNRLEVLNTIILTDGYNTDQCYKVDEKSIIEGTDFESVTFVKTSRVKYSEIYIKEGAISTVTSASSAKISGSYFGINSQDYFIALLNHYKATTGSRMFSFNIVSGSSRHVQDAYFGAVSKYDYEGFQTKYKTFKTEKFMEVTNAVGYDTMFMIMGGNGLEVDTDEMEVKSQSKSDLKRGFMKFTKGRSASRVFLNRFIDKVA